MIEPHLDIAADGKRALVIWRQTGQDRVDDHLVVLFDLDARTHKVFPQAANTDSEGAIFSPDGKAIACVRTTRSAKNVVRPTLTLLDLEGKARELAREWDRWPNLNDWSHDGGKLLVTAADDGLLSVFAIAAQSGQVERLTSRSAGGAHADISSLPDGGFVCSRSSLLDAPE